MSLAYINKLMGQPRRLFIMPSDWFTIWGMSHPDNMFYFVSVCLLYIKINILCLENDTWYEIVALYCKETKKEAIIMSRPGKQYIGHTLTSVSIFLSFLFIRNPLAWVKIPSCCTRAVPKTMCIFPKNLIQIGLSSLYALSGKEVFTIKQNDQKSW